MQDDASQRIYQAYRSAQTHLDGSKTVNDVLEAFLPMTDPINQFFDEVLVMTEDRTLRENRLALLQRITEMTDGVADLSKLQGF